MVYIQGIDCFNERLGRRFFVDDIVFNFFQKRGRNWANAVFIDIDNGFSRGGIVYTYSLNRYYGGVNSTARARTSRSDGETVQSLKQRNGFVSDGNTVIQLSILEKTTKFKNTKTITNLIYFRRWSLNLSQSTDLQECSKWCPADGTIISLIPQTVGAKLTEAQVSAR